MTSGASAWLVDERWFKAYPLGENTKIGRGSRSTIILRDPAVSRTHAEVKRERDSYVLHAYGSSETKLNGERVASQSALKEGDVVEIAFTALRFTQHAPTGEMFVVPRDMPTVIDHQERPTSLTLHAMHPIVLATRWRRHWPLALGLVLLLVLLVLVLA